MTSKNTRPGQTWLTAKQVAARFNVSVPTLWRWVATGAFPKPIAVTQRSCRWAESIILDAEKNMPLHGNSSKKG
jgi:predicted DNA-binding transcriptional regulator AlpA